ncbi:Mechanosensitive channel MscK precursor [Symmachiella dynata]|uniref:Mechanosensitive channel MscK n=2 Tax=Symmachiella dynata TaxID=2527995 RepID=A0A517ZRE1_9PLAN|nr:Mechanosensitive channel MscK precursor [Symmachiella dynata]
MDLRNCLSQRILLRGYGRRCCMWLAVLFCLNATAWGQADPATPVEPKKPPALTAEMVDTRLKEVEGTEGLDEALKAKIVEFYNQAKKSLAAAKSWGEKQQAYQQKLDTVDQRLKETQEKLELAKNPPKEITESPKGDDTKMPASLEEAAEKLSRFETMLSSEQQLLDDPQTGFRKLLADIKVEGARREARPAEIAASNAQQQLEKLREQLKAPPKADDSPLLALAQKTALEARAMEFDQQVQAERTEVALYKAEENAGLLRVRRDLLSLQVSQSEKIVKLLQEDVNKLRQHQAKLRARQIRADVISAAPELKEFAEENARLAEKNIKITNELQSVEKETQVVQTKYKELDSEFLDIKSMINTIGQSDAIGQLLRSQRATIPNASHYEQHINERQEQISTLSFESFQYEKDRDELVDIDAATTRVFKELKTASSPELETTVHELLESRKTVLDELTSNSTKLNGALLALNLKEAEMMTVTDAYAKYIDERVLWIRSTEALGPSAMADAMDALKWVFNPSQWMELLSSFVSWKPEDLLEIGLSTFLFLVLIYYRRRLRDGIATAGEEAARGNCRVFRPTLQASVLTVIVAAIWPSILWYFSWRISAQPNSTVFATAISQGLAATAAVYLPLEVIRQCCASKGLAEMHFYWANATVRTIRTHLRWATPLSLPLMFLAATMSAQPNEQWQASLGRASVVCWLILLAVFMQRVLRPHTGVLKEVVRGNDDGWRVQLRYLVFGLCMLVPVGMGLLALMGYYYTVMHLGTRLRDTVWLSIVLLLVHAMLTRLLLIHRRALAMERARAKREREREEQAAAAAAAAAAAGTEEPVAAPLQIVEEPVMDLAASSSQAQKLLRTAIVIVSLAGMWLIWADVVPALGVLNKYTLWNTTVTEMVEHTDSETGKITSSLESVVKPVTIVQFALAVLVGILAVVAAQNIPGLIEMSLLRGLPFEPGFRYAIASLARYVILVVGLAVSLGIVGIGWAQMQWLFAAASLGLGFGLQEIFANFISGIIILFERPIRVGDVITIGDVSGKVSKIRMRATTITNWDRKELIVPNKEFITGRLLNWTLTDQVNRLVIEVGVAYGSDTMLARDLLLAAAEANEFVLTDPGPLATFEGFGDSTLNYVLRVYLPDLDNRLGVIHALHTDIDRRFREANIEIAFPQQDIHVRTLPANIIGSKEESSSPYST